MSTLLDYARVLVNFFGFSIIPVPRPDGTHDGKTATLKWREFQTRHPTDDELRRWFGGAALVNLAILTGAISGIVVLDADSVAALGWVRTHCPETPWAHASGVCRPL